MALLPVSYAELRTTITDRNAGYDGLKVERWRSSEFLTWEIILRDFWGDILRPRVTPCRRSNANAASLRM
jgi:hypothetical protein